MSHVPHDSALTPSVNPSVSLIPPVNTSSSYFDGMILPLASLFPKVGSIDYLFHRYSVYAHGPEYSGILERILSILSETESALQIHFTGQFLPWHRWFIHVFEETLKNKCGYKGVSPYWNWTIGDLSFSSSRPGF